VKLTSSQFYALRSLVPHVAATNLGLRSYPGFDRNGPFSNRDAAPWTALEKRGLIVRDGWGIVTSGVFSWKAPRYRITEAGRAAYDEENVLRSPEGDQFRFERPQVVEEEAFQESRSSRYEEYRFVSDRLKVRKLEEDRRDAWIVEQVPGGKPTPHQLDWARDLKAAGFVLMPAETFLRLTLPVFEHDFPIVEKEAQSVERYQEWADKAPPPFLKIERGDVKHYAKVIGHEGRHRAAAMLRDRGRGAELWVAIILAKDGYAIAPYRNPIRITDTPHEALAQFRPSDYGGIGNAKLVPITWTNAIDLYE
jgi:hypothetical protein